jgi:hypothetical protein
MEAVRDAGHELYVAYTLAVRRIYTDGDSGVSTVTRTRSAITYDFYSDSLM